jgi:hypothetical protein
MEASDKHLQQMKDIWSDDESRQNAKIVLMTVMSNIDMPMVTANQILTDLDLLLEEKETDGKPRRDHAL